MGKARDAAASRLSKELGRCQARLMEETELGSGRCHRLSKPHRQAGGVTHNPVQITQLAVSQRIVGASCFSRCSSPLIYFILSELLRTYLLPLMGIGR